MNKLVAIVVLASQLAVLLHLTAAASHHRVRRIVGGRAAQPPPVDDPVVFVYKDDHDARVLGTRERPGGFYVYRGIRYAEPPVGLFRFQRPRPLRLEGIVNATTAPPPCIQPHPDDPLKTLGSEDCLYLNIYSSELPNGTSDGLPVIVWIHGGGFRRGSANQYGTGHLVDKKVVVVTLQYRLGSLGYMSTSSQQLPGNVAMFDMALAMNWIKEYISFFGGNPKNVNTMGQGTGASSAMMMGLSPMTQDNVKGIVAMSGSALSPNAVDAEPLDATDELAIQLGCPTQPHLAMVRCMQEAPADQIVFADETLQTLRLASQGFVGGLGGLLSPSPVVEGKEDSRFLPSFLPEQPKETLEKGNFPNISLLTGVCKDETGRAIKGGFQKELDKNLRAVPDFLNKVLLKDLAGRAAGVINNVQNLFGGLASSPLFQQAEKAVGPITKIVEATTDALFNLPMFQASQLWSKKGGKAMVYSFEHTSPRAAQAGQKFLGGLPLIQAGLDAPAALNETFHGDDLAFVFDARPLEGMKGDATRGQVSLTEPEDMKVRDIFTSLIADFAHSGQEEGNKKKEKPRFPLPLPSFGGIGGGGKQENNFLVIDQNPRVGKNFRGCQMAVWSGLSGAQLPTDSCADILKNAVGAVAGTAGKIAGGLTGGLGGGGLGGLGGGRQGGKPQGPGGLFG